MEKGINTSWHISILEYYTAIKMNKLQHYIPTRQISENSQKRKTAGVEKKHQRTV